MAVVGVSDVKLLGLDDLLFDEDQKESIYEYIILLPFSNDFILYLLPNFPSFSFAFVDLPTPTINSETELSFLTMFSYDVDLVDLLPSHVRYYVTFSRDFNSYT